MRATSRPREGKQAEQRSGACAPGERVHAARYLVLQAELALPLVASLARDRHGSRVGHQRVDQVHAGHREMVVAVEELVMPGPRIDEAG